MNPQELEEAMHAVEAVEERRRQEGILGLISRNLTPILKALREAPGEFARLEARKVELQEGIAHLTAEHEQCRQRTLTARAEADGEEQRLRAAQRGLAELKAKFGG